MTFILCMQSLTVSKRKQNSASVGVKVCAKMSKNNEATSAWTYAIGVRDFATTSVAFLRGTCKLKLSFLCLNLFYPKHPIILNFAHWDSTRVRACDVTIVSTKWRFSKILKKTVTLAPPFVKWYDFLQRHCHTLLRSLFLPNGEVEWSFKSITPLIKLFPLKGMKNGLKLSPSFWEFFSFN